MEPVVLEPGAGEIIAENERRTVAIKAGLDPIAVTETRYEEGERGPDPHIHYHHTDAFYVLAGELLFSLGPELTPVRGPAGSFFAAPPEVVHTFRNDGPTTARFLNFHAPSLRFHDNLRAQRDGEDASWFDQHPPPADGGRSPADAVFNGPGEGERIGAGTSSVLVKGTAEGTDDFLFLSETTIEPGFAGPPPHLHRELTDLFYVLDGTLTLRVGDVTVEAVPGTFACFPPGTVHTFTNADGAEPVRFLNANTPAGWEGYLRDLGAAFADGRQPAQEEIGRIVARYDFRLA